MKFLQTLIACASLLASLHFLVPPLQAQPTTTRLPKPPNPETGFVQDYAHLLSAKTVAETNQICTQLWNETAIPIYVVTLPADNASLVRQNGITRTTRDLFYQWGIGTISKNRGTLLLISHSNRLARIEFGKAWDHRYDNEAHEIMEEILVPNFRSHNYDKGVLEGTKAIDSLIRGLGLPAQKAPSWLLPVAIGAVLLIIGVAISLMLNGKAGWGWALLIGLGALGLFLLKNSKNNNPLGGGSSGGGGATGKW